MDDTLISSIVHRLSSDRVYNPDWTAVSCGTAPGPATGLARKGKTMETRSLGTTGLTVSRIGLGLAALGRPGYINLGHARDLASHTGVAALEAQTHAVLDAAWAAGS